MEDAGAIITHRIATSFAPVVNHNTHTLILGSMPGKASLDAQQYYAHPRNAFWPILCQILDMPVTTPYAERLGFLQNAGIGLWDVLAQCERPGSLDSDIKSGSIVINNFSALLCNYPEIQWIFFNGATAEQYFRRHVLPPLTNRFSLQLQRLPSTSPAHASLSMEKKLAAWKAALQTVI